MPAGENQDKDKKSDDAQIEISAGSDGLSVSTNKIPNVKISAGSDGLSLSTNKGPNVKISAGSDDNDLTIGNGEGLEISADLNLDAELPSVPVVDGCGCSPFSKLFKKGKIKMDVDTNGLPDTDVEISAETGGFKMSAKKPQLKMSAGLDVSGGDGPELNVSAGSNGLSVSAGTNAQLNVTVGGSD